MWSDLINVREQKKPLSKLICVLFIHLVCFNIDVLYNLVKTKEAENDEQKMNE